MGQEVANAPLSGHHRDDVTRVGLWHPAGRSDITPLRAQLLCMCALYRFTSAHIAVCAKALGASEYIIKEALQLLIDKRLLLCCITPMHDIYVATVTGKALAQDIMIKRPEMGCNHLTKIL